MRIALWLRKTLDVLDCVSSIHFRSAVASEFCWLGSYRGERYSGDFKGEAEVLATSAFMDFRERCCLAHGGIAVSGFFEKDTICQRRGFGCGSTFGFVTSGFIGLLQLYRTLSLRYGLWVLRSWRRGDGVTFMLSPGFQGSSRSFSLYVLGSCTSGGVAVCGIFEMDCN